MMVRLRRKLIRFQPILSLMIRALARRTLSIPHLWADFLASGSVESIESAGSRAVSEPGIGREIGDALMLKPRGAGARAARPAGRLRAARLPQTTWRA